MIENLSDNFAYQGHAIMQAQNNLYNRQHNDHSHSMTIATPRQDNRDMNIPAGTIEPLGRTKFRLPFRFLRVWIFSLLALVALPLGSGLILVGIDMTENLDADWEEMTATVISHDENGVVYRVNNDENEIGYQLDDFVTLDVPGQMIWTISVCDVVSRFIIPEEEGAEFSVQVNPDKDSQQSCVPINQDFASIYLVTGLVLAGFSIIRLFRTFSAAATKPVQ